MNNFIRDFCDLIGVGDREIITYKINERKGDTFESLPRIKGLEIFISIRELEETIEVFSVYENEKMVCKKYSYPLSDEGICSLFQSCKQATISCILMKKFNEEVMEEDKYKLIKKLVNLTGLTVQRGKELLELKEGLEYLNLTTEV